MNIEQQWQQLEKEILVLKQLVELLGWDQETYLPPKAVKDRSEQSAYLQGRMHQLWTRSETQELLAKIQPNGELIHDARLRYWQRELRRLRCLPQELVERQARAVVKAQAAWSKARQESDFAQFLPHLEELVDLARTSAQLIGWQDHPYSALLDGFEPGATVSEIDKLFKELVQGLERIMKKHPAVFDFDNSILHRRWKKSHQVDINLFLLKSMGFDLTRGRLDETTHPFCTSLGADDVRLTTRYDLNYLPSALYGTIHEMGHGLYEQGFSEQVRGTILAQGTSLGIHESQSRFWENMVARNPQWVHWFIPHLARLSGHLISLSEEHDFAKAVNRVQRSFIRVEADETTYSLHIILRYEIEKDLIAGKLGCRDVPELWNQKSQELLGITPPNDRLGCLQDIHWSMGGFGYFPTYVLGNLYSAQFRAAMMKELPLGELLQRGDHQPLLQWLRHNIHQWGSVYVAGELVKRVSGSELSSEYFLNYLDEKYQLLA